MPSRRETIPIDFDRRRLRDIAAKVLSLYGPRKGLRVLLAGGAPGDRQLTATQLAKKHGKRLERIDLAVITAEGAAHTEKSLKRLIETAAAADSILFFDEADALFGRRSGVADSHGRYERIAQRFLADIAANSRIVIIATADPPGSHVTLEAASDVVVRFEPGRTKPPEGGTDDTVFSRPLSNRHFLVEIGNQEIGFCQVSAMGSEHAVGEGDSGKPGALTYHSLVLRRAVSRSKDLYLWRQKIVEGTWDRRQVDLYQLPRAGAKPVNHWTFINCWPRRWQGPAFDALEGDGLAVEEIELCYERFVWL
ncbi:MAG: phage tail protein [Pseudomonadota bacterium]